MHETLKALVPKDQDLPTRAWTQTWREEFRTGLIYNRLAHEFHEEKTEAGEYVPLSKRRPSVRFGLPMIIVNDTTSLLFSEGHFPTIDFGEDEDRETLFSDVIKHTRLKEVMLDASVRGSVGSVAIWFRLLKGRIFWKVLPTTYLTPTWDEMAPDELVRVTEKYKITGRQAREMGYPVDTKDNERRFWFHREWSREAETWYVPYPVQWTKEETAKGLDKALVVDGQRTVNHNLGFVPLVWIKNLPGGDDIDGTCTFEAALDNSIEIDYQLSQAGRGLKYSSDPTLHIKEPAYQDGGAPIIKGGGQALVTSVQGEAKLLEISGAGAAAVLDYAKFLREISLELCGGNRTSPERLSGAQSGRAMELMNQSLILLADKLRTAYGEWGLVQLLRMVVRANEKFELRVGTQTVKVGALGKADDTDIVLKWPPWYAPTTADHQAQATGIQIYRTAGVLSRETAIKQIQHDFDIEDPAAEIKRIETDEMQNVERQAKLQELTAPYEYGKPIAKKAAAA